MEGFNPKGFNETDEFEIRNRHEGEAAILADAKRDFFEEFPPSRPKYEIGQYVASQGFSVPVISSREEWEEAFDQDQVILRSEMPQDYRGFSGLLSSKVLRPHRTEWDGKPLDKPWLSAETLHDAGIDFRNELGELLYCGLRSGELPINEYLANFYWPWLGEIRQRDYARLGFYPQMYQESASAWRYVPGMNIRIFRDPHVDGRYHVGLVPEKGFVLGYRIDKEEHGKVIEQERAERGVPMQELIELYEAIRTLPRFDQRQLPLLELQMDDTGKFYFLQYLKTGQKLNPVEPYDLPADGDIYTENVRGITPPEGESFKMYIAPRQATKAMRGEGFYYDRFHVHDFAEQFFSMIGHVVVHNAYVSMKNNHFSSAPLYRPKVALGLHAYKGVVAEKLNSLVDLVHGLSVYDEGCGKSVYVESKVVSNGRKALLQSDFEPHYEEITQF